MWAMKIKTYEQVATAKERAEAFERNVLGDEDRAEDFADMDVEDYADLRGIEITENPNKRRPIMTKSNVQLRRELREANERIAELEQEKADVLDALGIEVVESDDEETESDEDDEEGA